ncbi:MAG: sulfotransferase domain-containing protein, partial [Anaerolineales bacterium]|nr:sulfotransferase domain-containing protein [Anaerolineales bacterium]
HDLMKTTGCADARDIREKYKLQNILTEVNCNIGVLSARRLGMVTIPALMGNTFVIKAHSSPTLSSRLLSSLGLLRPIYIYRDPRDAMLSAYDYGQRALAKGRPNAFSHLTDFEKSLDFILEYIFIWEKWTKEKNVLIARYEDLLTNFDEEFGRLVKFLNLDRSNLQVQEIGEKYRPGANDGQQGLHFFKGKIGRFQESYTTEQKQVLAEKLGRYLIQMGYEV